MISKLALVTIVSLGLVLAVSAAGAQPVKGIGTTLNQLTSSSPYRVFNDLMKQSTVFVPYEILYYTWIPRRKYGGYNLTLGDDIYPTFLEYHIYAQADISFFSGIDDSLVGKSYQVSFDGNGTIGVYQNGTFNITVNSSQVATITLGSLNKLMVYVYFTDTTNLVRNIRITPVGGAPTFTSNFMTYAGGFEVYRFCFWEGEGLNRLRQPITPLTWNKRVTPTSATQISPSGIAYEHIIEFEAITGKVGWYCIPEAADSDYISNMAQLFSTIRNPNNIMYLEYTNVYSVMNDVPDNVTTPRFENWMNNYGTAYRSNVLFVVSYTDIQYFINAMGSTRVVNWTYIDAIGMDAWFGDLTAPNAFGLSDSDLKTFIISQELARETTYWKASQLAALKGLSLVCFSGGPYLKVPQYGHQFLYDFLKRQTPENLIYKNQEIALAAQLEALNRDPWMGELILDWAVRMRNLGVKTVMFYQLVEPWTDGRWGVPLLRYLNGSTTSTYDAVLGAIQSGRVSQFPLSKPIPTDNFICTPSCVWGDCINNSCICYVGYTGVACDVYTPVAQQQQIGTNLAGIVDWSGELPFVNTMRTSRSWIVNLINGGWGSGQSRIGEIPQDSDGYPTSLPTGFTVLALISRDLLGHYDSGTYIMLYEGDGTFVFGQDDVKGVKRGVGRIEIYVTPTTNFNNGIMITITRTNPLNYVRNIRVIRPGFEAIQNRVVFHPLFLSKIQPYSTLRFMDWGLTNSQTNKEWTDRTLDSWRTFTINGASFETMIRLCNTLGKNMWVNVPHLATTSFITNLAQLINAQLRPDLQVYVEYSNEVWGTLFPGGQYAQKQGLNKSLSTDPTQARFCYLGEATKNISIIFKSVFSNPSRVVMVISTQAVNADTTRRILACGDAYKSVDAVAVAPYFAPSITSTTTLHQLFTTLIPAQLASINTTMKKHSQYATQYGIKLMCYEAGQGMVGPLSVQSAAQKDHRMADAYVSYLGMLNSNGVSLVNLFTDVGRDSNYGSWGLFEYTNLNWNASQKWQGVEAYLVSQSTPPAAFSLAACSNNCSGAGICSYGQCFCYADYQGANCELTSFTDWIECGYKCSFHGTCLQSYQSGTNRYFSCFCDVGYYGATCSIAICTGNCSFQGKCTAAETCSCFEGRKGPKCEIDCGCKGHGTCSSTDNTCVCDTGYQWNSSTLLCEVQCNGQSSSLCYGPDLFKCSPSCVNGDCRNGTCVCWPSFSGATCSQLNPSAFFINDNLGVNLAGLAYWSTQYIFRNHMYSSSQWIPQYYPGYYNSTLTYTWNTGEIISMTADGYPSSLLVSQKVGKLILRDLQLHYPKSATNRYVLTYDGQGLIELGLDASILTYKSGRIIFLVKPSVVRDNGVYIQILKTDPENPIRNIKVFLESDEYLMQEVITDSFKDFISQFSTIRFMDLSNTNGNPLVNWADNNAIDLDTQATGKGLNPNLLVEIIRRSGRNAWVNVPHQASDDYINQYAQLLLASVPINQKIYVEYSNQVWNSFFAQGKYAIAQAAAQGLPNQHVFYGKRSLEIFNIFSNVFGPARTANQLRFVVSGQAVSTWVAKQIFSVPGLKEKANILAIAPYFDCNSIGNSTNSAIFAGKTVADILNRCLNTLSTLDSVLQPYQQLATNLSLSFACYEAGTAISEQQPIYTGVETPALTTMFIAVNRDPLMYDIYLGVLLKMQSFGLLQNAPTMLFSSVGNPSKYGSWGLLDYEDQVSEQPTHPKYQAVRTFNSPL